MSASYVRNKVEQWCHDVATTTGVTFHETINFDVDPQESVWWTVEYLSLYSENMLCKKNYLEQGIVRLVFVGQPGTGWTATITALESVIPLIMAKLDNTRRLELTDYEPVVEDSGGSADVGYMVSVAINYIHKL